MNLPIRFIGRLTQFRSIHRASTVDSDCCNHLLIPNNVLFTDQSDATQHVTSHPFALLLSRCHETRESQREKNSKRVRSFSSVFVLAVSSMVCLLSLVFPEKRVHVGGIIDCCRSHEWQFSWYFVCRPTPTTATDSICDVPVHRVRA